MILLVTAADIHSNDPEAFQVVRHLSSAGHTACSGPHVKYTKLAVPTKNVLCSPGTGAAVVSASIDCSAVLVGAMSVGIMRAAFDAALAFAKGDNRRGAVDLLSRQDFADKLIDIKLQIEASRLLTWKAAHCMEKGPGEYDARRELALSAKVFCSEACTKTVTAAINAVGMYVFFLSLSEHIPCYFIHDTDYSVRFSCSSADDVDKGFAELLNTAMVLPIFDGGNVGVRRRHMQELMAKPAYDALAATWGPASSSCSTS